MNTSKQPLTEFALIEQFFQSVAGCEAAPLVELGIGDDCALLQLPADQRLAISMDTLVEGRHFPVGAPAADIAYRALAVAISDLAAMGATPLAVTLAVTLPAVAIEWLRDFSRGVHEALLAFSMPLVGGDTTQGPLAITVQAHGCLPRQSALLRSGARPGDKVWVSGCLGDARAALALFDDQLSLSAAQRDYLYERFYRPQPRLQLGQKLLSVATAAIDISDGLLADLGHIARRSGVAAELQLDTLPLSDALLQQADRSMVLQWAATGGDDYELCFTADPAASSALQALSAELGIALTCIGTIVQDCGGDAVVVLDASGNPVAFAETGYQHYSQGN